MAGSQVGIPVTGVAAYRIRIQRNGCRGGDAVVPEPPSVVTVLGNRLADQERIARSIDRLHVSDFCLARPIVAAEEDTVTPVKAMVTVAERR